MLKKQLAPFAKEVRGIETITEAVQDAKENTELTDFNHVHFFTGQVEKLMPKLVSQTVYGFYNKGKT